MCPSYLTSEVFVDIFQWLIEKGTGKTKQSKQKHQYRILSFLICELNEKYYGKIKEMLSTDLLANELTHGFFCFFF